MGRAKKLGTAFSPQRIAECDERFKFICKFRDAASGTIDRFEGNHDPQASN